MRAFQRKLFFVVTLCFLVGASCSKINTGGENQVIARVNGHPVYLQDFELLFERFKNEIDEISQKNPRLIDRIKTRSLNEAIVLTLLRLQAEKRQLLVAKEEVESRLVSWKEGYPPGGFEEMLRRQNTTEAYLRQRIYDQLLVEKVTRSIGSTEARVSDEEIKSYYSKNKDDFTKPSQVHAYHIVVPTLEEAKKVRQEITSNKISFQSAARKYSLSPDAATGGDLGFFAKDEKIPEFNAVFDLKVNDISDPIKSRYGIHLLKPVEKVRSRKLDFAEAKNDVTKAIRKQKEVSLYKEWVKKLIQDGEIYRNETLYSQIL